VILSEVGGGLVDSSNEASGQSGIACSGCATDPSDPACASADNKSEPLFGSRALHRRSRTATGQADAQFVHRTKNWQRCGNRGTVSDCRLSGPPAILPRACCAGCVTAFRLSVTAVPASSLPLIDAPVFSAIGVCEWRW